MYYTPDSHQTSIVGKNCMYYIRIFTVRLMTTYYFSFIFQIYILSYSIVHSVPIHGSIIASVAQERLRI